MPRITIMDPCGICYTIATRQAETVLRAWFDEVLPHTYTDGRAGVDDFARIWPRISVWPMWAWGSAEFTDPDWLCDSRVLGRMEQFPAADGDSGLRELLALRHRLEAELTGMSGP